LIHSCVRTADDAKHCRSCATTNAIKRTFDRSTVTSTTTSDIPFTSHYKPGGTLCTAVGQWASHVADTGQDPHGLGRWSYILLRTRNERGLIIATAYRVCQNARGEQAGPITAYTQQRTLLRDTYTTPHPQQVWDRHFREQLQLWADLNYDMIIMLDSNEVLHSRSGSHLWQAFAQFNMVDAFSHRHTHLPPLPNNDPIITYQRGRRRLDYIMVTSTLAPAIRQSGYLSYASCIHSNHRGVFVDLDAKLLFGRQPSILPPTMRALTTRHPRKLQNYLTNLTTFFDHHNITKRSADLLNTARMEK